MAKNILGISGRPIKNSNTDRLIKEILKSSGLASEFVKFARINARPCMACKKCVTDHTCKVPDIDYSSVEDQNDVWQEAGRIGRMVKDRLVSNN